jgi:hypothetical protein
MKISTCCYCGVTGFTNDAEVCFSCEKMMAPAAEPTATGDHAAAENVPGASVQAAAGSPSAFADADPAAEREGFGHTYEPAGAAMDARCLRCQQPVARGRSQCDSCENPKRGFPFFKCAALLIALAVGGFFGFEHVFVKVSPYGIMWKSAKNSGWDSSIVYENFAVRGEAEVQLVPYRVGGDEPLVEKPLTILNTAALLSAQSVAEANKKKFSFRLVFVKPDKVGIELIDNDGPGPKTIFKQVFDGERGWKYVDMPNQPVGYEDTGDAFSSKKMGLGAEEFRSLEFLTSSIGIEYGVKNVDVLTERRSLTVDGETLNSDERVTVQAKMDHDGKPDATLLVFDRGTGLLMGMMKKTVLDKAIITTHVVFDCYQKFRVKYKGLFGSSYKDVMVPTKWRLGIGDRTGTALGPTPYILVNLTVENFETDSRIEEGFFQKQ